MGRVARAGGSGGAGERAKTIGKPRTKRRKRKDLEELHRNVLEAKRNLHVRTRQKKKRKTSLGKVLNTFADTRQTHEDANHGLADKQDGKKKSRSICNRLLPNQIFGIYQNGAKGQEVRRANRDLSKTKAARLEGDVLKLLNGDETNPKLSRNGEEKWPDKRNSADTLVSGETKGVPCVNGERKRMNLIESKNASTDAKNEQQQFHQRENNCKRRLFEPNEDNSIDSCCLGNAAIPMDLSSDEIRLTHRWGIARNVSLPKDCFRKSEHVATTEAETRKKPTKQSMPIDGETDANFWGWSPAIYYETLCAKISAENFENNHAEEPRNRDPMVKIRRTLRDLYRNTSRSRGSGRKAVIVRGNKCREEASPGASFSSTTEVQACTADSEVEQESSDNDASKVGSWRPRTFGGICNQKDPTVLTDTNGTVFESENGNKEDRTHGVEKTIHEVSSFLERLREDNPSNEKGNIFEVEVAAARLSQQKQRLTSEASLKNFAQKSTKHVPSILRRSNSRHNFGEAAAAASADEKQREASPSSNWPVNGAKRITRTTWALPQRSFKKPEDFEQNPTPSVVAYRATVKAPGPNIRKSKSNIATVKYRLNARSSSSEYQEHDELAENHGKNMANERESSTSRRTDFAEKKFIRDFYQPNFRTCQTGFSEVSGEYQLPDRACQDSYRHYSSFQTVCSDVTKKLDTRERRQNVAEKMDGVRPRYSPGKVSRELRLSNAGTLVRAVSRHSNVIQLPAEGYVERVPTDETTKNRSLQPLPSYRADGLSLDRSAVNEAVGCAERSQRGVQRTRKPVMLFRPIQETRQRQEICDSRYRLSENAEATINDAVTNFRVLTFDENSGDHSSSQRHCSQGYPVHCQQQQQQQSSFTQPHFIDNTQPAKYRAIDAPDGRNPHRLPIYIKADANQVAYAPTARYNYQAKPPNVSNALAMSETSDIMYLSSSRTNDRRIENTGKVEYYGIERQLREPRTVQTNQVTLVLPHTAPYYQQPSANPPVIAAPVLGSSNAEDIPDAVYSSSSSSSMAPCKKTVVPMEMRYQMQPPLDSRPRYDNEQLAKTIQFPDGRVGIIMTDNCPMGNNPDRFNGGCGPNLPANTIDMTNLNAINLFDLSNERIYY